MDENPAPHHAASARRHEDSLACVREALRDLAFGSVTLTVHESRIVQIDVTRKQRLRPG